MREWGKVPENLPIRVKIDNGSPRATVDAPQLVSLFNGYHEQTWAEPGLEVGKEQ